MTLCRLLWKVLLCLSCVLISELAQSDINAEEVISRDFVIRRWTTDAGLPQNRISALAQTPDGYLWLGTWFGLVRFDGVRFTVFNRYNTAALANDTVNVLATGPDGALWIGTHDGLVRLRSGNWTRFTQENGLAANEIWDLAFDSTGLLWVASGEWIGQFPNGKFSFVNWPASSRPPARKLISHRPDRAVFVITHAGAAPVSNVTKAVFDLPSDMPPDDYVHLVESDPEGRWLLGTWTGLWRQEQPDRWRLIRTNSWVSAFDQLFYDNERSLWAASHDGGLYRFTGTAFEPVKLTPAALQPDVNNLLQDREGSIWVGTSDGLFQLRVRGIRAITRADGLPINDTWSVTEAPDGSVWVAGAILAQLQPPAFHATPGPKWKWGDRCVQSDESGAIWMNTSEGVAAPYRGDVPLQGRSPNALYVDRQQRLWAGNPQGAHCVRHFEEIPLPNLPHAEIRFTLQTHEGVMWFGSKGAGLFRWREGELRQFTTANGLADNFVVALHEDADGVLWIATANGLNRLVPPVSDNRKALTGREETSPRFFTFTTAHGLLDNFINHIIEDDDGYLWFSSNRGIFRIARAELNQIVAGKKSEAVCAVFGTADGMVSSETNGEHQPAGCKARDGRLWFPTTMGIVVIDPKRIPKNEVLPGIVIEQVKVDDQIALNQGVNGAFPTRDSIVRLPPGRARTLAIRYTATTFVAPEKVRFRYKLEGHDRTWRNSPATERVATYTDLRPGQYIFRVQGCNNHGVWNESGASFAFSLAPKFTQTLWFPALCALGLLGVSGALGATRLRWQRRVLLAEKSASLERERARIARDLHDDLGTALTGLALEADLARVEHANGATSAFQHIATESRNLAQRMREVVWAINPRCDSVDNLAGFFGQYAEDFLANAGVRCRLNLPPEFESISLGADARHQIFAAFKEALHNIVKHSRCSSVQITIRIIDGVLEITLIDDGIGFKPELIASRGTGLRNMRDRSEALAVTCVSKKLYRKVSRFSFACLWIKGEKSLREYSCRHRRRSARR